MPWWWGYTEPVSPRPPRLHRISTHHDAPDPLDRIDFISAIGVTPEIHLDARSGLAAVAEQQVTCGPRLHTAGPIAGAAAVDRQSQQLGRPKRSWSPGRQMRIRRSILRRCRAVRARRPGSSRRRASPNFLDRLWGAEERRAFTRRCDQRHERLKSAAGVYKRMPEPIGHQLRFHSRCDPIVSVRQSAAMPSKGTAA